jgi:hypothetical protein
MIKGEIFFGKTTRHPIVFLREENSEQFIGCIITKAKTKTYQNNIPLISEHFEETDEKGNRFQTQFINSYLVSLQLIKKVDWGPFVLTGKLTDKGVQFIEAHLKKNDPMRWSDYMKK